MQDATILFKYASRSRTENFFRGLDSIVNNVCKKDAYHVLCSFDADDKNYMNRSFVDRLEKYENVSHYFGISHSKICAINRDLEFAPPFDILINFSDDQIFTMWGFDDLIRTAFQQSPSGLDTFIHFHDNIQPRLATMSIIGKIWFDRTGVIYHPTYYTEYADNEEQEKAKKLGKYKYMGDKVRIMQHINPYQGRPDVMDELYRRNSAFVNVDKDNYFNRLKLNFDL